MLLKLCYGCSRCIRDSLFQLSYVCTGSFYLLTTLWLHYNITFNEWYKVISFWAFLENETNYLKGSWFHHDFGRIKYYSHEYLIYLIHIHRKGLHFSQCRIAGLLSAFCVEFSILSLKCMFSFSINYLPLHWVLPFEKTRSFETHLTELQ